MARNIKYKYEIRCYYIHDELDEVHKFQSEDGAKFEALYLARFYDKVQVYFICGITPEDKVQVYFIGGITPELI